MAPVAPVAPVGPGIDEMFRYELFGESVDTLCVRIIRSPYIKNKNSITTIIRIPASIPNPEDVPSPEGGVFMIVVIWYVCYVNNCGDQ